VRDNNDSDWVVALFAWRNMNTSTYWTESVTSGSFQSETGYFVLESTTPSSVGTGNLTVYGLTVDLPEADSGNPSYITGTRLIE
jgi:hypothetical protein